MQMTKKKAPPARKACTKKEPHPKTRLLGCAHKVGAARSPKDQASLFSLMLKPIWLVAPLPPWLVCSEYSVLTLAAWKA